MKYTEIKLSEEMQESLEIMNYKIATEIQEKAIPIALKGENIIGQAQTGTGKTAAFAIPIIENTDIESKEIQHLILAPTRELATQIMEETQKLGKTKKVNIIQIIGGISYDRQRERLKTKPQIIVGTPGRIRDYLEKGKLKIHNIKSFTLDEVDQLLSIGFQKDIEFINNKLPKNKQMFFFSATFGKKVIALSKKMVENPKEIKVSTGLSSTKTVKQEWILAKDHQKYNMLKIFLQIHKPKGAIIFCRTRRGVENLIVDLKKDGFNVDGIQGNMEQRVRSKVIQSFKNGVFNIVAGTDVLARGIDVGHADFVYNYDLPEEIENYTHRIGRVGRAGKEGIALSFVQPSKLSYLKKILRETDSKQAKEIQIPKQEELDKIVEKQRYEFLNKMLERKNKQQLSTFIQENYSTEDMAKMLSVIIKKEIKTYKVEDLLKGHSREENYKKKSSFKRNNRNSSGNSNNNRNSSGNSNNRRRNNNKNSSYRNK